MPRTILIFAAIAAVIYIALCFALFLGQRSFIYYPQPRSASNNSATLTLEVDGQKVLVDTRPAGSDVPAGALAGAVAHAPTGVVARAPTGVVARAPTGVVIYFGGNAEDVSQSLPTLAAAFPDRSLFAMNYPGYGGSTGKPSEATIIGDALALFDRVHKEYPNIILIGRSLGSGVAVHVASERPIERLVLVTPYDSLVSVAATQFGIFPLRWLMLDKFESWRYAPKVTAPTQLIAAQNDEVIPFSSTAALYKSFPQSLAHLTTIPGVGHNNISESPQYIPLLRQSR